MPQPCASHSLWLQGHSSKVWELQTRGHPLPMCVKNEGDMNRGSIQVECLAAELMHVHMHICLRHLVNVCVLGTR